MPTHVQLPLSARPHNNQQLFSDHYLDVILPKNADWRALASEAVLVMQRIADIFDKFQANESNENQTEDDLIKPVLKALGHTYEVQSWLRTPDGTKKPDYILYNNEAAQRANRGKKLTDDLPKQGAFAVGDAKYWDRPLDKTIIGGTGDPFTNKNPSYQIAFYIQHSGLDWGILTNGHKWRLYHKESAHKLAIFYEVDLPELLAAGNPELFLYFYGFFSRGAFESRPVGVAAILQESDVSARDIGDTLKSQVYEALRHLAQGFLDYAPNRLQPEPETLKQIYDSSLIVLYRMLFILYAEARGLLPLRESDSYRDSYSLESIKKGVARELDRGARLLNNSAMLWPRLKTLFNIINAGSPPLKVATFNGGLFDPDKHPFLEGYTVGDGHLQQAIDMLTRVGGQFVDYRDLAVRHLGTIYEGLLEYHLEPLKDAGADDDWRIALLNDKGERKASGSYYTPDYIVKYIVHQTLDPLIEKIQGSRALLDAEWIDGILSLNVLDPAIGSGHFLVEATEYLALRLAALDVQPPGLTSDETDLAYWKRRVVQSCIYGVDLNPLAVELAKLSLWLATVAKGHPLSFLDHHLRCGNSLIGARIADLRLNTSLTAAQKRARKQERELLEAGHLSMLEDDAFQRAMSIAVDSMWLIEENPGLTVEQVKEQEQVYDSLRETLTRKYGRLADLVTAGYFGVNVDVDPQQWQTLADYATGRTSAAVPRFEQWLTEADAIAEQRRFFHWELEFPEVFFARDGQQLGDKAGFDAVIGNPPYDVLIRSEQGEQLIKYVNERYYAAEYNPNLFALFTNGGWELTRDGGGLSLIVPNAWLTNSTFTKMRDLLLRETNLRTIVDLQFTAFDEVVLPTCIFVARKVTLDGSESTKIGVNANARGQLPKTWTEVPQTELASLVKEGFGRYLTDSMDLITYQTFDPLDKHYIVYRGVETRNNSKYLTSTPRDSFDQPILQATDIERFRIKWGGMYVRFVPRELKSNANIQMYQVPEKVLLRRTGDALIASVDHEGYLASKNLYLLIPKSNLSADFLCAVLCSNLMNWERRRRTRDKGQAFAQLKGTDVSSFPIRRIDFTTPTGERQSLAELGRALYETCISEHSYSDFLEFVEQLLSQESEASDVVHDLLAYLAQQMLDLNKQRQEAVENFILDLEGVLPLSTDLQKIGRLWTPRAEPSKEVQAQLGPLVSQRLDLRDDIGKVNEDQWKWLLKVRLKTIPALSELVKVFRKRQPAIAELDSRIAFTDGLIDKVVYRLYGLTEDEVAIVEGGAGQ